MADGLVVINLMEFQVQCHGSCKHYIERFVLKLLIARFAVQRYAPFPVKQESWLRSLICKLSDVAGN